MAAVERGVRRLVSSLLGRNRDEPSVSRRISQISRTASTVKVNIHQCTFLADMAKGLMNDIGWSTDLLDCLFVGTLKEELLHILNRALQLVNFNREEDSWLRSTFMHQNHSRHFLSIIQEFHSCLSIPMCERQNELEMCSFLDEQHMKELLEQRMLSSVSSSPTRFMADVVFRRLVYEDRKIPFLPQEYSTMDQGALLGSGGYGVIFKGTLLRNQVAVKQLHHGGLAEVMREAEVMAELSGPDIHILQLIGFASEKSLVMELMKMDIRELIHERNKCLCPPFSLSISVDIMCQVAEGMNFLHNNNIIHRDLKPANVLVHFEGESCLEARKFTAKITDFGTSKCNFAPEGEQTSRRGTIMYMSPEMLTERQQSVASYSLKTDVFSFGIMCYEIITGGEPFEKRLGPEGHLQELLAGVRPSLPGSLPLELRETIQACWNNDPDKRPTFQELCNVLWKLKTALIVGQDPSSFQSVMSYGVRISEANKAPTLIRLLSMNDPQVQGFATGMLLNLSLQFDLKWQIKKVPHAMEHIVAMLKSGSMTVRENAAATLYCLKEDFEDRRVWAQALPQLTNLTTDGSTREKRFAQALLFFLERKPTLLPVINISRRPGKKISIRL